LFDVLRNSRLSRNLTQEELARKLGIRQRQISDLERSTMDPRLSTIQNVGRALDLELMLIPRQLISTIEGLQRAADGSIKRPMYALADRAESHEDDESRVEVGSTGELGKPAVQQARRSKDSP
jgi:transcriptional regulator with XRE-family HTH domain